MTTQSPLSPHPPSIRFSCRALCPPLLPQVDLTGSSFDTLLAAYTGTDVGHLSLVASNDNCTSGSSSSCVTFSIVQGTVYRLQVGGAVASMDMVAIAVTVWATPANDAFSAAGTTLPANGTTLGATMETGERVAIVGRGASGSVWYSFSAAANGNMQVLGPGHFETPPNAPIPQALARTSVNCTVVRCGL